METGNTIKVTTGIIFIEQKLLTDNPKYWTQKHHFFLPISFEVPWRRKNFEISRKKHETLIEIKLKITISYKSNFCYSVDYF